MRKILLAWACLSLALISEPFSTKAVTVPERPDLTPAMPFINGTVITFKIQKGTGELTHSGTFSIFSKPDLEDQNFGLLVPIRGNMQIIRDVTTNSFPTVVSWWNLDDSGHVGNIVFTNLAPLAGTFTNVMFDSTNVPAVVIGRQKGTFFRTENRVDLNRDGDAEILYQNDDGRLGVWFMTNSIRGLIQLSNQVKGIYLDSLYSATGNTVDPTWRIVGERDFNQDGMLDWFWQNTETGNVKVWLINNTNFISETITNDAFDTSFVQELSLAEFQPPDNTSKLVGLSDFDNDGYPDFLYQAPDGSLFVVYSSESFTTDHKVRDGYVPPPGWRVASIADLNHDGWPDIIFQHPNGSLRIWLMHANGQYWRSASLSNATYSANLVLVGNNDFDHDGSMDLLFRNKKTGALTAWYLKGLVRGRVVSLLGPNLEWNVVAPK